MSESLLKSERRSNSNAVPILVVHSGYNACLERCLRQLRQSDPNVRVVLIGDESNDRFDFVEHYSIRDWENERLETFRRVYRHCSPLGERFERFCVERWFLVDEFVRRQKIERFLCLDSDVFVYCRLADELTRFENADLTFAVWDELNDLVHCLYVGRAEILDRFCRFVLELYQNDDERLAFWAKNKVERNQIRRCKNYLNRRFWTRSLFSCFKKTIKWIKRFERPSRKIERIVYRTWVSDMALWKEFERRFQPRTFFWESVVADGICFDPKITDLNCGKLVFKRERIGLFNFFLVMKRIRFVDGVPWGESSDGSKIQMKTLHYHGYSKRLISFQRGEFCRVKAFVWGTSIELFLAFDYLKRTLGLSK